MEINESILKKLVFTDNKLKSKEISEKFEISEKQATIYKIIVDNIDKISDLFESDDELKEKCIKYKKEKQRFQDINRVERKTFREITRYENAVISYIEKLKEVFDNNPLQFKTRKHRIKNDNENIGVIQLTDLHFNEQVVLDSNKYNFKIASQRVREHIVKCLNYFKGNNVGHVIIALTGDLLNSDRRLDELLTNADNRSKATFLAIQILENAILEVNKEYNISIISVLGNESRLKQDISWENSIASDNYDYTIYNTLAYHMRDVKGIEFLGGSKQRQILNINGHNWLFIHGHQSGFNGNPANSIKKLYALYSQQNIRIRYVIFGHLHEALITDTYARSASTVGANSYSEENLMLMSRASQNAYIAYKNGNIDSIKIDLQEYENPGYHIQKELESYNTKSDRKNNGGSTIIQIVI